MSLMKLLKVAFFLSLSFIFFGMTMLYFLFKLITHPKRIVFLYHILKRKSFSREGQPPPDQWNDPSLGEHGFLRLKEVKLHYVACGDEDKPLMLFIHGLMDCWYTWRFQIREFSKYYRVVAIDRRGYSLSDCPEGRSNYTWFKNCMDVAEVIEALGYNDCVLVGYELGAKVALTTALHYPEKVSKLIVFNSVPDPIFASQIGKKVSDVKFIVLHLLAAVPYLPEFLLSFNDFISFETSFLKTKDIRKENLTKEDIEVYKYAFSQKGSIYAVCDGYRNLIRPESSWTHKIDIYNWKILHIYGPEDKWITKAIVDQFEKCCPNGVFKTVKGGTHFMHQDQPEVVNALMKEFLDKTESN